MAQVDAQGQDAAQSTGPQRAASPGNVVNDSVNNIPSATATAAAPHAQFKTII